MTIEQKEIMAAWLRRFKSWLEDGLEMTSELEEILKQTPPEVFGQGEELNASKSWSWNPDSIKWTKAEGLRGEYERYPAKGEKVEMTRDYKNLLEDLKAHNGKLTRDDYFYWLFSSDSSTIGRKKCK